MAPFSADDLRCGAYTDKGFIAARNWLGEAMRALLRRRKRNLSE
jgi:hypothetical protein